MIDSDIKTIKKALKIATKGLRDCYTDEGILAGKENFVDYWSWDSFFASLGSLELGDFDIFEKNVELYLKEQRPNGQLPYRIISINQILKYLHIKKRFKHPIPNYNSIFGSSVVDQNLMLLIMMEKYLEYPNGKKFVKKYIEKIEAAYNWLRTLDRDKDNLIEEGLLANWMDHMFKRNKVLVSNVKYWKCHVSISNIMNQLGNCEHAERYSKRADKIKKALYEKFWNGTYFIDWIDWKKHYYFDTSSNLFATIWGLTSKEETEGILKYTEEKTYRGFVPKANWPNYPLFLVQPQLVFSGMPDYAGHRVWIGALYAMALFNADKTQAAKEKLLNIADSIVKYGNVYELYGPSGKPARRWPFYTNEVPFAWSSGMFVWAVKKIFALKSE